MSNLPKFEDGKKVMAGDSIAICKILKVALEGKHIYPALTGGTLYKDGERKDVDIVLYRNRQLSEKFETSNLEKELKLAGLSNFQYFGFVTKCMYGDIAVDLFNPETEMSDLDCESYSDE